MIECTIRMDPSVGSTSGGSIHERMTMLRLNQVGCNAQRRPAPPPLPPKRAPPPLSVAKKAFDDRTRGVRRGV